MANTSPPTCPASLGRSRARSGRDLAEPQDICLECLCFRVLAAMGEVLTEWVAGGVPPRGSSIRRPPQVCQRRAKLLSNWLCPITTGQSRHSFAQFDLKCFFPYPFLSPPAWGPPQTRNQNTEKFAFFAFFLDFFGLPTALEKRHQKNIEKDRKSRILISQTSLKILPKYS